MKLNRQEFWHSSNGSMHSVGIESDHSGMIISVSIDGRKISFWPLKRRFATFGEMRSAVEKFVDLAIKARTK